MSHQQTVSLVEERRIHHGDKVETRVDVGPILRWFLGFFPNSSSLYRLENECLDPAVNVTTGSGGKLQLH